MRLNIKFMNYNPNLVDKEKRKILATVILVECVSRARFVYKTVILYQERKRNVCVLLSA